MKKTIKQIYADLHSIRNANNRIVRLVEAEKRFRERLKWLDVENEQERKDILESIKKLDIKGAIKLANERERLYNVAISKLNEEDKFIIVSKYQLGQTTYQIANELYYSVGTIKNKIVEVVRKLQKIIATM